MAASPGEETLMSRSVEEALRAAARLVHRVGWRRDDEEREGITLVDALTVAINGNLVPTLAGAELATYTAARRYCQDAIGRGDWLLTEWNDDSDRNAYEVISLLRHAAVLAQVDRLKAETEQRTAPQVADVEKRLGAQLDRQQALVAELRRQVDLLSRFQENHVRGRCVPAEGSEPNVD